MATARGFSIFSKNTPPAELSTSSTANETSDKSAYLAAGKFPYDTLMGDWTIIGSSLALWKNRSDVLCRYTPHTLPHADAEAGQLDFSDEIWYEQLDEAGTHLPGKGARREVQSMIRGRNRLDTAGANHASFFWRGYWLLKPFTSRWQVLAFSDNFLDEQAQKQAQASEPVWIVTYFTATWFTDAGIDLYARGNVSEAQYDTILEALRTHPGDDEASKELRSLAEQMFRIPTGNV